MVKIQLDVAGLGRVLRSPEMRALVDGAGQKIAAGARSRAPRTAQVVVEPYTTDRDATAVVVKHPRAASLERKNGILIPAARAIGAEVRPK